VALALAGTATGAFGTVIIYAAMAMLTIVGSLVLKWVFIMYGSGEAVPARDSREVASTS